jgi:hypothetical protein
MTLAQIRKELSETGVGKLDLHNYLFGNSMMGIKPKYRTNKERQRQFTKNVVNYLFSKRKFKNDYTVYISMPQGIINEIYEADLQFETLD